MAAVESAKRSATMVKVPVKATALEVQSTQAAPSCDVLNTPGLLSKEYSKESLELLPSNTREWKNSCVSSGILCMPPVLGAVFIPSAIL